MNATNPSNPYAPPTAEVRDTSETDTVEPADRGTRLGAAVVDFLIGVVVAAPLLFTAVLGGLNWREPSSYAPAVLGVGGGVSFLLGLVWLVYTIYLVNKNGQTVGKKLLGIKVVRSDGSRASLGRIFWLRNVVNAIPGLLPVVGYLYNLADALFIFGADRQCLHDKIADTIVVRA
ncbi:MAG: RDD family protein [Povalibacter sp.]